MRRLFDNIVADLIRLAVVGGLLWAFWQHYGAARWPQWKAAAVAQFSQSGLTKPLYSDEKTAEAVRCQSGGHSEGCPPLK
ncbi:MAG: hypothetical protein Q4A62_05230 [Eikenella sp.]|nr:hypothetical protein [Eikenella sp.]